MKKLFISLIATILITNFSFGQTNEKFNSDLRVKEIIEIGKSFSEILPTETELINKKRVQIDNIVKELVKEYGKDNINTYIENNLRQEISDISDVNSGDNCHRRKNGPVNTDGCTGWEYFAYLLRASWNCGPGEAKD